ncbi:hypothetical protein [Butyrivibrio virus Ceridwen]|nr:hypothetical protein [Butyrivibrio virus Ceridwen]
MPTWVNQIITIMQMIISLATICTLGYTFKKFVSKPTESMKERIEKLEKWSAEVDRRLDRGEDHFGVLDESARVTQQSLLAIMDTLINGDNKEELLKARNRLYEYLSDR